MKNKLTYITLLCAALFIGGCSCTTNEGASTKEEIKKIAEAALEQYVYSSLVKDPAKMDTYLKIIKALEDLKASTALTPKEISADICAALEGKVAESDYATIIDALIEAYFDHYSIGWSEKLDPELTADYIQGLIDCITAGIDLYNSKVDTTETATA